MTIELIVVCKGFPPTDQKSPISQTLITIRSQDLGRMKMYVLVCEGIIEVSVACGREDMGEGGGYIGYVVARGADAENNADQGS